MQMEEGLHKRNSISFVYHFLYLCFFTGLIFSFRSVSSISLGLIFLTGLIFNRSLVSDLFRKLPVNYFMAGCILFSLLQLIAILYTNDKQEGWEHIRLKAGVAVTPLAVYCSGYLQTSAAKRLFFDFCLVLAAASLYCIAVQVSRYAESGNESVFFYHSLVTPLRQHAVYFSIFIFISIVYLFETLQVGVLFAGRAVYIILLIFFTVFLVFLSSKLVIIFFIVYLLYGLLRRLRMMGKNRILWKGSLAMVIISVTLVLVTNNPVNRRFSEVLSGDINLVSQDQYTPSDYFNGLQFRLLQWKLVPGILDQNKAWLHGVSPGDAQSLLVKEYILKHMYAGDIQQKDKGYLDYNTHNQFLQSLLQTGVTGLIVFLFLCFYLVKMAIRRDSRIAVIITLLLLLYAFTESVLETQYGVIIFTFFPVWLYLAALKKKPGREAGQPLP